MKKNHALLSRIIKYHCAKRNSFYFMREVDLEDCVKTIEKHIKRRIKKGE